ncbi:hypothetical protein ACFL6U_20675 [Planctomycetota bacterium]
MLSHLRIALSTDQGVNFTPVWSQTDLYRTSWVDVHVPLEDYVGQSVLLRLEYLPGSHAYVSSGGGLWVDNIRMETVTGSEYSNHPIYYAPGPELSAGMHTLAYQILAGDQAHRRSDTFNITIGP